MPLPFALRPTLIPPKTLGVCFWPKTGHLAIFPPPTRFRYRK
jgi:hypothetical protein